MCAGTIAAVPVEPGCKAEVRLATLSDHGLFTPRILPPRYPCVGRTEIRIAYLRVICVGATGGVLATTNEEPEPTGQLGVVVPKRPKVQN